MPLEDVSEREIMRLLRNPKSLFITCWNRLDLPPSSDASDVTKAYRRLSLLVHPDKAPPELSSQAHEAFNILSEAFQQALKVAPAPRQGARGAKRDDNAEQSEPSDSGRHRRTPWHEGATDTEGQSSSHRGRSGHDFFTAGGQHREWWRDKKSWEIEEILQKFQGDLAKETQASNEELRARREARGARAERQQAKHAQLAEEQEEWLQGAQEGAEEARASWKTFVSQRGPKRRKKGTEKGGALH